MLDQDFIGHEGVRLVNYMSYADPSPIGLDLQLLLELAATKALVIDPADAEHGEEEGYDAAHSAQL